MNRVQSESVDAWVNAGFIGTCYNSVGSGKSFLFMKAAYKLVELGRIKKGARIRFWAESKSRLLVLQDEIKAFYDVYGKQVNYDFKIIFRCYQSLYKNDNIDFEVYDESDWMLTYKRMVCVTKSKCLHKLALTANMNPVSTIFREQIAPELHGLVKQEDSSTKKKEITTFINRGQLGEILLPEVYSYPFTQAITDGVLSPFQTIILDHPLNKKRKYIKTFKSSKFYNTEHDAYNYLETQRLDFRKSKIYRGICARKQVSILYELESKAFIFNKLKEHLNNGLLIFGTRKSLLYKVTDNVVESNNFREVISKYRNKEIPDIASSQMIRRGLTLNDTYNTAFLSYASLNNIYTQMLARTLRYQEGKIVNIFVFRTQDTWEETWFDKLNKVLDYEGNIIHEFDMNVVKTIYTPLIRLKNFKLEL